MEGKIFIVCGYGSIGQQVCKALKKKYSADIIVIDKNIYLVENIFNEGFECYRGDATKRNVLLFAGIKQADGLICTFSDDETNALCILTAKWVNPDIPIVSRVNKSSSITKIRLAGASKVVLFSKVKSHFFNIIDYCFNKNLLVLSLATFEKNPNIIELSVSKYYFLHNKQLSVLKEISDTEIIALKRQNGTMVTKPSLYEKLRKNDTIVLLSEKDRIQYILGKLKRLSYFSLCTDILTKVFIRRLAICLLIILLPFNYFVLFDNFLNWIILPAPPFTMGHLVFAISTITFAILFLFLTGVTGWNAKKEIKSN